MPIVITCPLCARRLRVPDSLAGQSASCPACLGPLTIPGGPPPIVLHPEPPLAQLAEPFDFTHTPRRRPPPPPPPPRRHDPGDDEEDEPQRETVAEKERRLRLAWHHALTGLVVFAVALVAVPFAFCFGLASQEPWMVFGLPLGAAALAGFGLYQAIRSFMTASQLQRDIADAKQRR